MLALKLMSSIRHRKIILNVLHKSSHRGLGYINRYHPSRVRQYLSITTYDDTKIKCKFHTSKRLNIPPGLALLIRPITRIGAFLFGRYLKRWWSRKTPEEKEMYKKWFTSRRQKIYGAFALLIACLFLFYANHIETEPLTGRARFIILNPEQQKLLGKLTFETHMETHKDSIVPITHPVYIRLARITDRLLKANRDLPQIAQREWTLSVVDVDMKNAYVLPNGNIFVCTGIFKIAENDDQLAIILAHEISHVLLQHPIEQVSRNAFLDVLLAIPIAFVWATFPDLLAILFQALGVNLVEIFLSLPYSRKLETEADNVGLKIAARACFDVREAVVFWGLMRTLTDLNVEPKDIPWLSTHPNHEDREKLLSAKMTEAIELRSQTGCPKLNPADPIRYFNALSIKEKAARFRARGIL